MNVLYTGALRHASQVLAGVLVSRGYVGNDAQELVVGAVVSVATLAWYLATARTAARK